MKKTLLLKIAGVVLLISGAFFTPLTSVAKTGPQLCIPLGSPCIPRGGDTPIQCCGLAYCPISSRRCEPLP
jgi:hypothetical protein